jgi:uncharacterized YccA/Bax inhibitor family protein
VQSRNPILNRIDKEASSGGSGFAYDEGRSAYQQATTGLATMDAAAAAQTGQPYAPAPVGAAVTINDVIVKTGMNFVLLIIGAVIGWPHPSMPWVMWVSMPVGGSALANTFMKSTAAARTRLRIGRRRVPGRYLVGTTRSSSRPTPNTPDSSPRPSSAHSWPSGSSALYSSRIIKVNGTFRVMMVALISYGLIALASFVAAIFGKWWLGFYGVGTLGLILCAFGVILAAFTLNLDFAAIEQASRWAARRESWRMSFGPLVTLIWLAGVLCLLALVAQQRLTAVTVAGAIRLGSSPPLAFRVVSPVCGRRTLSYSWTTAGRPWLSRTPTGAS